MTTATCEDQSAQTATQVTPPAVAHTGTYGQILKSSALVGGSQLINVVIGMVRTKAMAIFLGPAGFGLFGLFNSISTLTQTLAGMGINNSGVRQIAAAVSSEDTARVAKTTIVLRRVSLFLGLIGGLFLIAFARPISRLTFGETGHATAIAGLSLAVLFMLISAGQVALIQGMRRIADLARIQVIGAVAGTVFSIPLVYFFRERGVVPSLICVAATTIFSSWWYSRKIPIDSTTVSASEISSEAADLLKLGLAFMTSNLLTMGVAYAVRVAILRNIGYEATGLYQSAWTLGCLYVGFILQAMGADFYPRLTLSIHDHPASNRLVNEQARVGLLLAGPGVIATLAFAPLVVSLFYSAKFGPAVAILRWICLGTILQVITWPLGFIIVAQARRVLFIGCELAWSVVSLALAWFCIRHYGLAGAGIAFFGSYIFHGVMVYAIAYRLTGFRWSVDNLGSGTITLSLVALTFCGFYVLPFAWAVALGTVAMALSTAYSVRVIVTFIPADRLPKQFRKLMSALKLKPAGSPIS